MSFDFSFPDRPPVIEHRAEGFPPSAHPAEPDLFCRQAAMPGHDQQRLESVHVAVVGCGGLGSWIALGLARMGVQQLTLIDPDIFDRTNAPRQLMLPTDVGRPKAHALARNIEGHMTNAGVVRGIALPLDDAVTTLGDVQALVVGVDNNRTRLAAADLGRHLHVPVVFAMLSRDGLRAQIFRQDPDGPCLSCVLPNLDPDAAAPCAAASIASCYLAAAHAVHMVAAGFNDLEHVPTWRESSVDGSTERAAWPPRRPSCRHCQAQE